MRRGGEDGPGRRAHQDVHAQGDVQHRHGRAAALHGAGGRDAPAGERHAGDAQSHGERFPPGGPGPLAVPRRRVGVMCKSLVGLITIQYKKVHPDL